MIKSSCLFWDGPQLKKLKSETKVFKNNFVYLFVFGRAGSLLLCELLSSHGMRASHAVASLVAERGLHTSVFSTVKWG